MKIHISGCVNKSGEYETNQECNLGQAIQLAGGIKETNSFAPTGVITIKTKLSENSSKLRKIINFKESPSVFEKEKVQENDIIIIQTDGEVFLGENPDG